MTSLCVHVQARSHPHGSPLVKLLWGLGHKGATSETGYASSAPNTRTAASQLMLAPSQRSRSRLAFGTKSVYCAWLGKDGAEITATACWTIPVRYRKSASCGAAQASDPLALVYVL